MAAYIIALLIFSDPWSTIKNYWSQYKNWLNYNSSGNYYNWSEFQADKSPDKWKFGASLGIGFIPPGTKKYHIAEISPAFDFNLSCKGIWFHTNLNAIFDKEALQDWFTQFATNFLYTQLMTFLYSNNTIGQLLSYMNNLTPKYLDLNAKRCNDQELMALVHDPRFKELSWSQRLCVNAKMTAGESYSHAIEDCKNRAGLTFFANTDARLYSCFDKLQIDDETRGMLRALLGYVDYAQHGDTALNVRLTEPQISITELFDSIYTETARDFDSAVALVSDTANLPADMRYTRLYYFLSEMSPPGGAITPEVVLDMVSAPTTIRQTVRGVIASTNAYIAVKMILDLAFRAINVCMSKNNVNISPTELEELRKRWDNSYKEFTLITKNFNPDKLSEIANWLREQKYYYVANFIITNAATGFEPLNLPTSDVYLRDLPGPIPPVHDWEIRFDR